MTSNIAAQAASAPSTANDTVAIPFLTCSACHAVIEANAAKADAIDQAAVLTATAANLIESELWPADGELVGAIRSMFLTSWGMSSAQADARMSRLNYLDAANTLAPLTPPGAIGSAYAGGIYAGVIRGVDGAPDEYLVLLPGQADNINWDDAGAWVKTAGGALPTRAEQRLLMANLPDQFEPRWYWSSEPAGPSYAWDQHFGYGTQDTSHRSYEGRARAVRRLPI